MKPEKIRCGIFTFNREYAKELIDRIAEEHKKDIKYIRNNINSLELMLNDDTHYVWIRPIDSSRGWRCSKAMIDLAIDYDTIRNIVQPICIYCEEMDYQTFDSRDNDGYTKASRLIEMLKNMVAIYGDKYVASDNDGILTPITDIWYGKVPVKFNEETREDVYDYGFELV